MNITIIGNGKVGSYLADKLLRDKHKLTIVDCSDAAIEAADSLDAMTVTGSGSSLSILKEAGVENCDMLIAVTGSDEVNMLCCLLGKRLGARYTIARVRDTIYNSDIALLKKELSIDMTINPEYVTAREIARMIKFPEASEVESFCGGRLEMVSLRVEKSDFLVGKRISDIMKTRASNVLFCVAQRGEQTYIPNGSFKIQQDDKLYVIGRSAELVKLFRNLGRYSSKVSNVMISGGSRIAYYLCRELEKMSIKAKIIEIDPDKCRLLSEELHNMLILQGDGTDQEVLKSENLQAADAFISLTNRDEDNLITALYAMQCGVPKVIAKNNRTHYTSIIQRLGIEGIISPKVITGNQILQFVRGLDNSEGSEMLTLYQIANGSAEAMEFLIGNEAPYVGVKLKDVPTHNDVLIAAIIRGTQIIIPNGEVEMLSGDNVVIVTSGKTVRQFDDIFKK